MRKGMIGHTILMTVIVMMTFLIPFRAAVGASAYISNVNARVDEKGFVTISGYISTGPGHEITVKVTAPDGSPAYLDGTASDAQGNFRFIHKLMGGKAGRYHVTIGADDLAGTAKTSFDYLAVKPGASGTIMTVNASIDANKKVTVDGTVSTGTGQQVAILIKDPRSNTEHVNTAISSKYGEFGLSYVLKNPLKGRYVVSAAAPGSSSPVTAYFEYGLDADLKNLSVAGKSLNPVFRPGIVTYTTMVDKTTQSIRVSALPNDRGARIRINGVDTPVGAQSAPISLQKGSNLIRVEVTAQDGVTKKTYTIIAEKGITANVTTTIKAGVDKNRLVTVKGTISSGDGQQITVRITDPNNRVEYVGSALSRNEGNYSLQYTIKNNVTGRYTVTAGADGMSTPVAAWFLYDPSNADLKNLTVLNAQVIPGFAADITQYDGQVPYSTNHIQIIPESNNEDQLIKVNDLTVRSGTASANIALYKGRNTVRVNVTSQDGTKNKTYVVIIERLPPPPNETKENPEEPKSDNALLSGLVIEGAEFSNAGEFSPEVFEYTAEAPTGNITVIPTVSDSRAIITVNNDPVQSGSTWVRTYDDPGEYQISIVVTAEDGTTTKTYIIILIIS